MLLNKVVAGRVYNVTVDNATLTEPPAGYDSVSDAALQLFGEMLMRLGPGRSGCSLEI